MEPNSISGQQGPAGSSSAKREASPQAAAAPARQRKPMATSWLRDVIVFRYPRDPAKSYIKRVIAVAGDRVRIEAGVVFVNGTRLREMYVPRMYEDVRSYSEIVVPPHSYFVLGDHRNLSNDSRDFGPVDEAFIYGKAVFGYWPVGKLGILR